ncbi:MAG: HAMP domain-containing histidine kinase [Actinobacteria bacterium]|nr:HAMP domain-containing histidine kinase [Actinomycetota bacterium]
MTAGTTGGPDGGLPAGLLASPLPTGLLDRSGQWAARNAAMAALLGEPPPAFAEVLDEPRLDVPAVLAARSAMSLRAQLPGGGIADAIVTPWGDGSLVQLVDRAELHRVEARLADAVVATERFVSRVSHDLKNPIGTAQGYAELLIDDPGLTDEGRSFAERILSSTANAIAVLVAIVTDAREASRVVPPDEVDLAALVDEVRADLAVLIADRGAVVTTTGTLPTLRSDRRTLQRALAALVRNAVEHHPGSATVEISARPAAAGWAILVDDDGHGIPPARRDAALGLVPREGAAPLEGVGLALTRAAVARHGGELQLEQSDAGGLRARLVLPQRRARDPEPPAG